MHVAAVAQGGMSHTADLYFSFRSPYSYLAIGRYRAIMAEWDLDIALRPVYPLARFF
jgi:2-hydroxychromene-2-carboxylate isomerase